MIRNEKGEFICEKCHNVLKYNRKHDAEYCDICDLWAIKACGDPECDYCNDRPEKPSMCKNGDEE